MQKYFIYLLVGIVIVICVYGLYLYFHSSHPVRNYPSPGTDIIAFGDSLVEGVGATPGHDLVSLLSKEIGAPIVNLGRSGDTTADGLARISELDSYKPKVVILILGGNDYLAKKSMPEAFERLGKIIEQIQARGAIVLLVGIRLSLVVGNFDAQYRELERKYQTAYVPDVLDGFYGKLQYMSDNIHPNDAGYAIIASRIAPTLQKLIR
ncbi:MAG: acyl-CoA thioesterase [Patescibacteria group bacterium]|nr:acyl-CoA thioesterase [Patescibacteria group bacterium]